MIDFYCGRAAGGVGLETALYVANQGTLSPQVLHFLITNRAECPDTLTCLLNRGDKEVTVVEMTTRIGHDVGTSTRWTLISELRRLGVSIINGIKTVGVTEDGSEIESETGGLIYCMQIPS